MANLYQASHQWATRPDDERFATVEEFVLATRAYRQSAATAKVPYGTLRVEASDGDLVLAGKADRAKLTHYSFGQLASRAGAPAGFLRTLPATLSAQVLNHQLKERGTDDSVASLLFHKNGTLVCRAVTSDMYDRIWNHELAERVVAPLVRREGWRVPPARPARSGQAGTRKATAADVLPNGQDFGLRVKVGDDIAPAGLYASDHDMFAFLVNTTRVVKAGNRALMRGCFLRNSEVGDGSLLATFFLLDNVCGNHICFGAEGIHEIRIRHVSPRGKKGASLSRFVTKYHAELLKYSDAAVAGQEARIAKAMALKLGTDKDAVIDALFKYAKSHSLGTLTRARLESAYDTAELHADWYGSPHSVWGMVSGLTENSQLTAYADERTAIDRDAGELLEIAF